MSKDTFWFYHDADAADDDKTMLLIEQLGLEGYGIYWVLIEKLRSRENYKMPFSIVPSLARRYMTTPEKMKTVITQYGLFDYDDDGFFFSQSLINRMQRWDEIKEKRSIAGKKGNEVRWSNKRIANESQTNSKRIANESQTIASESQVNRKLSREEKRREDNILNKKEDTNVSKKKREIAIFDVRSDLSYVDKEFEDIWMEWLEYKDEIKKQYKTQKGASRQYTTLVNLSDNNPVLAYAIVQRSIEHSWDGVFELNDKQKELYLSDNSPYAKTPKNAKSNIPQDGDVNEKGEVWSEEQQKWLK